MLEQLGLVSTDVPVVAVVHDCQVVDELVEASHDCLIDFIACNSRLLSVWGNDTASNADTSTHLRRVV